MEYFPLDAQDERDRHWTPIAPMNHRRTEFAVGFFPSESYFADFLVCRSPFFEAKACIAVIVAGGSDGSDEEYLRSVECNCWVDLGDGLESSSCWTKLPDMLHPRGYCTGCVLPDGRFVVMGGRSRRGAGPARRRDGEVFDPRHHRWRMLPHLPAVFGESPELTICAAGPSLLVAAMVAPDDIGGARYVAALQVTSTPTLTNPDPELDWRFPSAGMSTSRTESVWRDHVAIAAAEERWVVLGSLPYRGEGPGAGWDGKHATSLLCVARQRLNS